MKRVNPAQTEPLAPVNKRHHHFEVMADGLGRYTIDISLPQGYELSNQNYPVVLTTDGNLLFDRVAVELHSGSAALIPLMPEVIIVGVGYPADEGYASFYARRNFDFHGEWDMQDPLGQSLHKIFNGIKQAEGKPDMQMSAGGAPRFSAFLREELLPHLAASYPIDLGARHTLIGDSSGGHYVLRDLYDDQSLFSRYVCISPGFSSARGAIRMLDEAYAARHKDMEVDLFICCGDQEVGKDPLMGLINFGSGVTWVAEQFSVRGYPSANVHWEIMNNEDHGSILSRAISAGLRSVFRLRPGVHPMESHEEMAARLGQEKKRP
ncbi:alpha/beta hydrolase [Pseudomaricurvus alkylphenolicus]|uniref:alpha/beta hydrolase n=1 Tax=Pseudomaricurvus alkylphenolicus TaxID=1306991 RepID=UPI001421C875|nr:alpha/beta hydrolase-fold protein [Pseudomaricurvus alkylphenolicus]NIB38185.1 alpha/beta hydrolase [Pseudomaricurvus alkylphenolicus]